MQVVVSVGAVVGLKLEHLAVAIGDEGVIVVQGQERELGARGRPHPPDDQPDGLGARSVGERRVDGFGQVGPAVEPVRDRRFKWTRADTFQLSVRIIGASDPTYVQRAS